MWRANCAIFLFLFFFVFLFELLIGLNSSATTYDLPNSFFFLELN